TGGDVIGSASEEAAMEFGPGLERPAPDHQILMVEWQLPDTIGALAPGIGYLERHEIEVFRPCLEIIEFGHAGDGSPKRWMNGNVGDDLAIYIDLPAVLEHCQVLRA